MDNNRASSAHLRFAACSLAVVAAAAAAFAWIGMEGVASAQERAAGQADSELIGAPLAGVFQAEGGATADARTRADAVASPLTADGGASVRAFDADGALIWSAGDAALAPDRGTGAHATALRRGPAGQPLLTTSSRAGEFTVEVTRPAAGLDSAIARSQRWLLLLSGVLALAAYGALQLGFRVAVKHLARDHRRLLYLYTVGQEIRATLDLHDVLTRIARDATGLAGGEFGLVAIREDESGELVLRATYDRATGTIAHQQRAVEDWSLHRCVATNMPVASTEAASGYRQYFGSDLAGQLSVVWVPMSLRQRVIGALAIVRAAKQRPFSPREIQQVQELSDQAVTAIEQAVLFAKVKAYADEVEVSYDATLKALMAALDAKDDDEEGHCERVARLTVHLAGEMGLPQDQLVNIERGALLHDVGKIGVPDEVLKKPDALNDLEWEAMRQHPLLAGLMISKIGFLEGALPILLYHHERYDGGGYPFGLTGDKIPLEARIFSVVDAYDAMTSERPYRPAMSHVDALAEVRANSDSQFDPDVVTAFSRLMDSRPELQHRAAVRIEPGHVEHDVFRSQTAETADPAEDAA